MTLHFYKYQGTGNDFVIIDNRQGNFPKNNTKFIKFLCDRKFGIGGDGLILLEKDEDPASDFKMVYYNSDGNESSMCGNGGRCIVAFAHFLEMIKEKTVFNAIDGLHEATINGSEVSLKMKDVSKIKFENKDVVMDTGSPHFVRFTSDVDFLILKKEGAGVRYSEKYKTEGINVNFVAENGENSFKVRTYERGVEDETLSCGTGVTAVALAAHHTQKTTANEVVLQTQGGKLKVHFSKTKNGYDNIWLTGPAIQVFKGEIPLWKN